MVRSIYSLAIPATDWNGALAFALIQGHRLLRWRSVGDFDNGIPPLDRLFLAGHAGLSYPSPLVLRSLSLDEMQRVVCMFGSASLATILTPSITAKEDLEQVVLHAVSVRTE
jgi:hypothetical protein